MSFSPQDAALRGRLGGLAKSARHDAVAGTADARRAFLARFEHEVDPHRELVPAERQRRAEAALRLHMARLAYRSAKARRKRSQRETTNS